MKKGFTLSEVMIALTVLGVLCVTVLPAIVSTHFYYVVLV